MTEQMETEIKSPARKKAKAKAKPKKTAVPKAKADDKYVGMTVTDCCAGCNAQGCVISGKSYCAHPRKGGLHPEDMSDSAALQRRKEAEKRLRDQVLAVR